MLETNIVLLFEMEGSLLIIIRAISRAFYSGALRQPRFEQPNDFASRPVNW